MTDERKNGDYPYKYVRLSGEEDDLYAIFYGAVGLPDIMLPFKSLENRMRSLRKEGYDAPLTQEAINIKNFCIQV